MNRKCRWQRWEGMLDKRKLSNRSKLIRGGLRIEKFFIKSEDRSPVIPAFYFWDKERGRELFYCLHDKKDHDQSASMSLSSANGNAHEIGSRSCMSSRTLPFLCRINSLMGVFVCVTHYPG